MRRRAREREQRALQAGALTWQAASLLLDYPGEEVLSRAGAVRDALPAGLRRWTRAATRRRDVVRPR